MGSLASTLASTLIERRYSATERRYSATVRRYSATVRRDKRVADVLG